MNNITNSIYQALCQFLFPSRCPSCRAYTEAEGQWCPHCLEEITRNKNLAYAGEIRQYISPVIAMGKYDKGLRRLIHELKFQGNLTALIYFKPLFTSLDEEWQFDTYDIVIPVPLHPDKLKQRGFNQVEKIFQPWCLKHGFAFKDILQRVKKTQAQYRLNHEQRLQNLDSAFTLKEGYSVAGHRCLLVDDIFTSGSTMYNCAKILKNNGATTVGGLVLASEADD